MISPSGRSQWQRLHLTIVLDAKVLPRAGSLCRLQPRISVFEHVDGFDWDPGNIDKNWREQRVYSSECEDIFFNEPYYVTEDAGHSGTEQHFYLLGISNAGRRLFVVFIIRNNKIRVRKGCL